jgi:hypothetical protein
LASLNSLVILKARPISRLRLNIVRCKGNIPVVNVRLGQLVLQVDLLNPVKVILGEKLESIVETILQLFIRDVDFNYGVTVCA